MKKKKHRSYTRFILALADRDGLVCRYCGIRLEYPFMSHELHCAKGRYVFIDDEGNYFDWADVDHVIPRAKGGTDDLDNLVLSCQHCNRSKGASSVEEFQSRIIRL